MNLSQAMCSQRAFLTEAIYLQKYKVMRESRLCMSLEKKAIYSFLVVGFCLFVCVFLFVCCCFFPNSYLPRVTHTVPGIRELIINGTAHFTEQVQVLQHLLFGYPVHSRTQPRAGRIYSTM